MITLDRREFVQAAVGATLAPTVAGGAARAKGPWGDGVRLVISVSMQFEAGAQPERGASGPFPPLDPSIADLPMTTWYDYGAREGIPRLLDLWDRHDVRVTSHMVGQAVERHPELAREVAQRGHEVAAHGQTWTPQYELTEAQERESIAASVATLERVTGQRPVGFNAFWLRGTQRTLGLLVEHGFRYHIDDLSRDEPWVLTVGGKPFAVVPYTLRNNDIVRFDSPAMTARAFGDELKDEFTQLYAEAATRRRMMSISVHDRIGGTPARVRVLDEFLTWAKRQPGVVFWRKDTIARFVLP